MSIADDLLIIAIGVLIPVMVYFFKLRLVGRAAIIPFVLVISGCTDLISKVF
jgi:hypothetical protein